MTVMVSMYHPSIPSTASNPVRVALSSADDHAARGWLLVDPGVTPPASENPYYTRAELLSQIQGGANPIGTALRAASVAAVEDRFVFLTPAMFGAVGDGVTDDFPAFRDMALAAKAAGRAYVHIPAGDYWLGADGVFFDVEWIECYLAAGAHVFTTGPTIKTGGALCFIGYEGSGVATSPRRGYAKVHGPGRVTGWLGGLNENGIGFVRYDQVVVDGPHVNAGNKGVTAQVGCPDITIRNITSDQCVVSVVSVEDQANAVSAIVEDVRFGTVGGHAVLASSARTEVRRITGDTAMTNGVTNLGAVHVTTTTALSWAEVTDVDISDCTAAKGVVISQALAGRVDRIRIGASGGNAVDVYNCANGLDVGIVEAPASPNGVVATGSTPPGRLRRYGRPAEARRALTSGEATMDRLGDVNSTALSLGTGVIRLAYFEAAKTETITKVRVLTGGSISTPANTTLMRVGVYSVADNGDLTLVASTPNDTALLAAINTAYTKSFSAPFVKRAGRRYAIGLLAVYTAGALQVPGNNLVGGLGSEAGQAPQLAGFISGLSDLPASSAAAPSSTAMPYFAVTP